MQIATRTQAAHFIEQPGVQHGVKAQGNARVQPAARLGLQRHQTQRQRTCARAAALLPAGHRPATDAKNFQRALDALRVVGCQPLGRERVDTHQLVIQRGQALLARLRVECCAHGRVGCGQRVQAVAQGFEVQHGAAHQQGVVAARVDLANQAFGVGDKTRGRIRFSGLDDVEKVVRHGRALGGARFGRADVHAAVDLGGVDADDLHRLSVSEGHRHRTLPRGRGPGQADHRRRHVAAFTHALVAQRVAPAPRPRHWSTQPRSPRPAPAA